MAALSFRFKRTVLAAAVGFAGSAAALFPIQAAAYDLGMETVNWGEMQSDTKAGGELGNITVSGKLPSMVSAAAADVVMAKNAYSTEDQNNSIYRDSEKNDLTEKLKNYLHVITDPQVLKGFGTINFNENTVLDGGAENQRLIIPADTAAGFGVARNAAVTIKNNQYSGKGGALNIAENSVFNWVGEGTLIFEGNTGSNGGALYSKGGTINLIGHTVFTNNTANSTGGAIFIDSNNVNGTLITSGHTVFSGNTGSSGAAISSTSGFVDLSGYTVFSGNIAKSSGGAIMNNGTLLLSGVSIFSGNQAEYGGAVYTDTGPTSISGHSVFSENKASIRGGAIYLGYRWLDISGNAVFTKNSAGSDGGAVYIESGSSLRLSGNSLFAENTDSSGANSIYFANGKLLVTGNGVTDMRDPMKGRYATINKEGSGTWYLGGNNTLAGESSFTVSGGRLHLYASSDVPNNAEDDGWVGGGAIDLSGSGSSFTLDSNAELSVGGHRAVIGDTGNAIAASTIILKDGATLGFDLGWSSDDFLALNGNIDIQGGLNINLLSIYFSFESSDSQTTVLVSAPNTNFSSAVLPGTIPLYKGEDLSATRGAGMVTVSGNTDGTITATQTDWVRPEGLTWTGVESGEWNFTNNNWNSTTNLQQKFWDGDYVIFNGSGNGAVAVNPYGIKITGMVISGGEYVFTGGRINTSDVAMMDPDANTSMTLVVNNAKVTFSNEGLYFGEGITFGNGADISFGGGTDGIRRYAVLVDDDDELGVIFEKGSIINFNFTDSGNDILVVDGDVTPRGGTVNLIAGNGVTRSLDTVYPIIESTYEIKGTFDEVTGNFAFVSPELVYSDSDNSGTPDTVGVSFKLKSDTGGGTDNGSTDNGGTDNGGTDNGSTDDGGTDNGGTDNGGTDNAQINLFAHVGNTFNQRATGAAVGSLSTDHAVLKSVLFMNADQARAAYDYFSGEAYGTTRSALLKNSANVRSAVAGRLSLQERPPYADPVWATAWGQRGKTDADGNAASSRNTNFGFLAGWDAAPTENVLAGVFAGYERTDVHVKARNSESKVDAFHLGAYAGTEFANGIRLYGSLAYSYLDGKTERGIPVAGVQGTATGKYNGWQVQAFAGMAKDFAVSNNATLTPYADIAHVWLNTGSTKESGSAAALSVAGNTDNATFTTLGVRGEVKLPTAKGGVSLTGDLGWQHAFGDIDGETVNRFADAGNSFTVRGTGVGKNSALVGVGLKAEINAKNTLTAGYRGAFGSDSRSHGAQVQWKMRF